MNKREVHEQEWRWAELVLPCLPPETLACLSSTCRSLRSLSQAISARRVADAARGLEKYPVPVSNPVDNCRYPYFLYATTSTLPTSAPCTQPWGRQTSETKPWPRRSGADDMLDMCILGGVGCTCTDCSQSGTAMVRNPPENDDLVRNIVIEEIEEEDDDLVRNIVIEEIEEEDVEEGACPCGDGELRVYINGGRISVPDGTGNHGSVFQGCGGGSLVVTECGPACRCDLSCGNRVSQRGLGVRVAVVRHPRKGWCLHSAEPIAAGTFVCEYAGELLTIAEARERQQKYDAAMLDKRNFCSALLVIREHLPSGKACMRLNIDATKIGNVARFINHSCDGGNLLPTLVRSSGSVLPRLCLFASREISEGEELTFSYGMVGENSKPLSCFCGTPACCGMLPSEPT